jgi:hypothetical protein
MLHSSISAAPLLRCQRHQVDTNNAQCAAMKMMLSSQQLHRRNACMPQQQLPVTGTAVILKQSWLCAAADGTSHYVRCMAVLQQPTCVSAAVFCREDEYDVTYVYGAEASNDDIHARSISPLIRKCLEGYNVCVMLFGATGKQLAAAGGTCTPAGMPQHVCSSRSSKGFCTAQGCTQGTQALSCFCLSEKQLQQVQHINW